MFLGSPRPVTGRIMHFDHSCIHSNLVLVRQAWLCLHVGLAVPGEKPPPPAYSEQHDLRWEHLPLRYPTGARYRNSFPTSVITPDTGNGSWPRCSGARPRYSLFHTAWILFPHQVAAANEVSALGSPTVLLEKRANNE
jgi:hypothetical protein